MQIEEARTKLKVLSLESVKTQEGLNQQVKAMTDDQALEATKLQEATDNFTQKELADWATAFLHQTAN